MTKDSNEQKNGCAAEIAAAFYINVYVILRPLIASYSYKWAVLLPIIVLLLFFISIAHRGLDLNSILFKKWFLFVTIVSSLFFFDYLLRRNEYTWENYYAFLMHGAITGLLLVKVRKYDQLFKFWTIFAIVAGIIYMPDPLNHYAVSGGYLYFGCAMLPAFIAATIAFSYYRIRVIAPLMIVFFIETVIYANKGATVSAIAIVAFFAVFNVVGVGQKIKRLVVLFVSLVVLLLMYESFLDMFNVIADKIGVGSYSLTDLGKISQIEDLSSFNSRTRIWTQVIDDFSSHYVLGMGIGGFQSEHNNYAHNFFIDVFITHGLVIGSLIIGVLVLFARNTLKFVKCDKELFLFSFAMFLMWFFPSQFSFTYWKLNAFWIFMFLNLFNKVDAKEIKIFDKNINDIVNKL